MDCEIHVQGLLRDTCLLAVPETRSLLIFEKKNKSKLEIPINNLSNNGKHR